MWSGHPKMQGQMWRVEAPSSQLLPAVPFQLASHPRCKDSRCRITSCFLKVTCAREILLKSVLWVALTGAQLGTFLAAV